MFCLNSLRIAFLHSILNFRGLFFSILLDVLCFPRDSCPFHPLWGFMVFFWTCSVFFIVVIGSRCPVSMYRHFLGVDCGVFRILFLMFSNILFISRSSFFGGFPYFSIVCYYWYDVCGYYFPFDFHFNVERHTVRSNQYLLVLRSFPQPFSGDPLGIRFPVWFITCHRYLYLPPTSSSTVPTVPVFSSLFSFSYILVFRILCGIFGCVVCWGEHFL